MQNSAFGGCVPPSKSKTAQSSLSTHPCGSSLILPPPVYEAFSSGSSSSLSASISSSAAFRWPMMAAAMSSGSVSCSSASASVSRSHAMSRLSFRALLPRG